MGPKVIAAPTRHAPTEHALTAAGFEWEYRINIPLDAFDIERSLQNQARIGKPLDISTVERYVTALRNGDVFPAIVSAEFPKRKLLVADGNHRLTSHQRTSRETIDSYVIVRATPQAVTLFTFKCNTTHGLPTSELERIEQALHLMFGGLTAEKAARELGVSVAKLRAAANMANATTRAAECGLNTAKFNRLVKAIKIRLNQITMNDIFADVATLAIDAGLTTEELNDVVSTLTKILTHEDQVKYLLAVRGTYSERIQNGGIKETPGVGRQFNTARRMFMMSLGQIGALPSAAGITERMTPDDKLNYLGKVTGAIKRLEDIRDALKQ